MSNIFLESDGKELILKWAEYRDALNTIEHNQSLQKICDFWKDCPFSYDMTIDPYSPSTWPVIWEQLYNKNFCYNAVSVGIAKTASLSEMFESVKLCLVDDGSQILLIVFIDNKWVVNYNHCYIDDVKIFNDFKVLETYDVDGDLVSKS